MMTREEAVYKLKSAFTMCEFIDAYGEPIDSDIYYEALDVAIEALQQPEIIRCEDCKKCQIEILCHDYWCDGKKVWKDHYCSYAERKEGE